MSKITEYEVASAFDANDVLLKDGENGTMIISVEDAASEFKRLGGINDDISGINQSVTQAMGTIASNIAGVETDYIASKDYAIGDLFIVNNVLYKATAAIAEEDVIDTEINCAVVNLGDEIGDIRSELSNKANVDGSYSTLTAGNAEQLVGTVFTEDDAAYTFRTSGGSADIGDREYDEIVGGSIVWNQLIQNGNFTNGITGWNFVSSSGSVSDNILTIRVTEANPSARIVRNDLIPIDGHKYLYSAFIYSSKETVAKHQYIGNAIGINAIAIPADEWTNVAGVVQAKDTTGPNGWLFYYDVNGVLAVDDELRIKNAVGFDLTQMFGSEIADYIYNLEQTTPGAGVAWFRKYFPKDYYEYNAGELMHVSDLQSHDMVGFNMVNVDREEGTVTSGGNNTPKRPELLDFTKYFVGISYNNYWNRPVITDYSVNPSTGEVSLTTGMNAYGIAFPVRVLPNTEYFVNFTAVTGRPAVGIGWYKRDGEWISYNAAGSPYKKTSPANAYFAIIVVYNGGVSESINTSSIKDLTFNLSWDGERDGEYEPYVKHSYPLDSSLTLRGVPKLSTDGKLYYDGDHYKSDGTVERRYGIVDIGALSLRANGTPAEGVYQYVVTVGGKAYGKTNVFCGGFAVMTNAAQTDNWTMIGRDVNNLVVFNIPYATVEDATTAMSGVYLVYELAEPTTEEAQPFQSPQIVDDFGTEEYVTSSIVPVGHITQYDSNLRAKLEMAPNSPDGDGDYLVRQTSGQNEYVPYTDGSRITALESKTPAVPSANGSYILKCTVTDGTATYAWVAE